MTYAVICLSQNDRRLFEAVTSCPVYQTTMGYKTEILSGFLCQPLCVITEVIE